MLEVSIGSTQNDILDILTWDLAAGVVAMNEVLPEINQRPSPSSVVEDKTVAPASHQLVTEEEVTAAAAVAALASKAASITASTTSSTGKRDRKKEDGESTTSSISSDSNTQERESERAERSREKVARLDGHSAVVTKPSSPVLAAKPMVPPPTLQIVSSTTAPVVAPKHEQLQPLGLKPPPAPGATKDSGDGTLVLELRPFPYFNYRDFSKVPDPDPLTTLTAPGRVPNFPAKMHAILARADLVDIVAWMPHGRAWRVLKPREFECRVIPTMFEHSKFSSFIRQANGWGFRRLTQGKDRNAYYHEMFLRGLPHLCKMMKRPGVSEKQAADPDQEPDFYKIADENPVPDRAEDDSILLQCTLQGGPKARMPIYMGGAVPQNSAYIPGGSTMGSTSLIGVGEPAAVHPPSPSHSTQYFYQQAPTHNPISAPVHSPHYSYVQEVKAPNYISYSHSVVSSGNNTPPQEGPNGAPVQSLTPLPLHLEYSSSVPDPTKGQPVPTNLNPPHTSDPTKQFAAGFAAAASLSPEQLQKILSQALANAPPKVTAAPPAPQQQVQHHASHLSNNEPLYLPAGAPASVHHPPHGLVNHQHYSPAGPPPHYGHSHHQPHHYQRSSSPPHHTQSHQHHQPAHEYHHNPSQHSQPQYTSYSGGPPSPPVPQQQQQHHQSYHMAGAPAPPPANYQGGDGFHHHSQQQP